MSFQARQCAVNLLQTLYVDRAPRARLPFTNILQVWPDSMKEQAQSTLDRFAKYGPDIRPPPG